MLQIVSGLLYKFTLDVGTSECRKGDNSRQLEDCAITEVSFSPDGKQTVTQHCKHCNLADHDDIFALPVMQSHQDSGQ